jgi:hypothetical protein
MRKANTSKLVSILLKENNAMANGFITKPKKTKDFAKVARQEAQKLQLEMKELLDQYLK